MGGILRGISINIYSTVRLIKGFAKQWVGQSFLKPAYPAFGFRLKLQSLWAGGESHSKPFSRRADFADRGDFQG